MNIVPKDSGNLIASSEAIKPAAILNAREKAIAAYMKASESTPTAGQPVANATRVAPEELSGLRSQAEKHISEGNTSSQAPIEETKGGSEEPLSSQYAILARKEKAIRQREQQLKARESAIKAKEVAKPSEITPATPSFDESKYINKDRLTKDPFTVLTELGLTYDQLTEMAMNAPKQEQIAINNELKALRDELKSLRGETESNKKSFEEQQTQSYQQAVSQIRSEAKNLIARDPNFETIRETNSLSDVVELIEETFKQDGVLLTVEEAAAEVEDYLVEEAMKIAKIKKIQQRLQPKASQPEAARNTESSKQPLQMKTLTNSVSSSRQLSSRERALLAFEGKLGK